MAENKVEITLTWENRNVFKVDKKQDGARTVIVEAHEDGDLPVLWPHLEAVCKTYFNVLLDKIGLAMKQP